MKNFVKKAAATTLSVFGILSAMPSAFCAPGGERQLDVNSIMIVGKYFNNFEEVAKFGMVNKRYLRAIKRYRFNPVKMNLENQFDLLPRIETYYIGENEGDFIYRFPDDRVPAMLYLPWTFDSVQFARILLRNGIDYADIEHSGWDREVETIDGDPMKGCRVTFENKKGRRIIFCFKPYCNEVLSNLKEYNDLLTTCGAEKAVIPLNGSLSVPNGITSIKENAFMDCMDLINVNIPSSVKSIMDDAFFNCSSLKNVVIPNSVTSIGDGAFYGCRVLESVEIPNSVTSIKRRTFDRCNKLNNIIIPNSVKSIGDEAFCDCKGLTNITIPTSVTSIEPDAFMGCDNLHHIKFNGNVYNSVDSFMEAFNFYRENHR